MTLQNPEAGDVFHHPDGVDAVVICAHGDTLWMREQRTGEDRLLTVDQLDRRGWVWSEPIDIENQFVITPIGDPADPTSRTVQVTVGTRKFTLRWGQALNLMIFLAAAVDPDLVVARRALDNWVDPIPLSPPG